MTDATPAAPPSVEIDDDDEAENLLDLRKTGRTRLTIEGETRRLRAPRFREYRKLYELWHDEAEALDAKSVELQEFMLAVMGRGDERAARGEQRITEEERREDRRLSIEIRRATEEAALRWWVETVRTLGVTESDKAFTEEDVPAFLTNSDSINLMLDHWRNVPSRSGAR